MKNIIKLVVTLGIGVSMASCLKDDAHFVDFAASGYVAEIPYAANRSILRAFPVSASKASSDTVIDVNIASPNPPTADVPITMGLDTAALTRYNATTATKYMLLPAAAYQIKNPMLTITAGNRIASLGLSFIGSKVPTTGRYAVPISIMSVPSNVTISANYHTQIVAVTLTK